MGRHFDIWLSREVYTNPAWGEISSWDDWVDEPGSGDRDRDGGVELVVVVEGAECFGKVDRLDLIAGRGEDGAFVEVCEGDGVSSFLGGRGVGADC